MGVLHKAEDTKAQVMQLPPSMVKEFYHWFQQALPASFSSSFPPEALKYYAGIWNEKRIAENGGPIIVGWRGKEIAGCCIATASEGGVSTIIWLFVDKAHRGTGLARSIFSHTLAACKAQGAHKVKLTAQTRQVVDFYTHVGMKQEGFHPRHWWGMDFWSLGIAL